MIISGNDITGITNLKHHPTRHFRMKDLGPLTYFLGIEILRSKSGSLVHQRKYTTDLITSAWLDDARTFSQITSCIDKEIDLFLILIVLIDMFKALD